MSKPRARKAIAKDSGAGIATLDSLANLLTGMGVQGKDKTVSTRYTFAALDQAQLEAAYRGDWIARKVVDIPALDMTREWRDWQAEKDEIEKIEAEEDRLQLQRKIKRAIILGRLYGGGALIMGASDMDPSSELLPERIGTGGLRYVHVVSCNELAADELETDVDSLYFNEPKSYSLRSQNDLQLKIHPSRVVRFVGSELPVSSVLHSTSGGWGDSVIQMLDDAIKNVGSVSQGVAALVQEAKIDVIKLSRLDEMVSTAEYTDRLTSRLQIMNVMKSLYGVTVIDQRDEWERKEVNFGTLPDIVQMYLLIASGAADIPATRLLGQSPAGMNATGESDLRNYYDRIRSEQTTELTPTITRLDDCLLASTFGKKPEDIWYQWSSLWSPTDSEKADLALKKAQTFQIDHTSGLIDAEALRKGRENQLIEDGTYPGIEQAFEDADSEKDDVEHVDETDPELMAASASAITDPATGAAIAKPQDEGLNGSQISSMVEIVSQVGEAFPAESAKAMLRVAFPLIEEELINAIIDPLASFDKPEPPPPVIMPGGGPPMPGKPVAKAPFGKPSVSPAKAQGGPPVPPNGKAAPNLPPRSNNASMARAAADPKRGGRKPFA